MKNVEDVVGSPVQVGCTVTPKGRASAIITGGVVGGAFGAAGRVVGQMAREAGSAGASPLPAWSGALGYLAVTADEIVLVLGKQGLMSPKAVSVIARAPRSSVAGMALGEGKVAKPLAVSFGGDVTWEFEIPRVQWKDADALLGAFA